MPIANSPDVSVVICTHNRSEMLRDALQSLISQETDGDFQFEVLVVDNASTDDTQDVVAAFQTNSSVPVRSVYEARPGQVNARNRGIVESQGRWIANFDDDQIADRCWLKELLRIAKQKDARSVGGAMELQLPTECRRRLTPTCRRLLGASIEWDRPRRYTRREGPGSGNQMIHRSVYDDIGVYDESYTLRGYDSDLYRRMRAAGIESWFTPYAKAWHVTPEYRLTENYFHETSLHNGWFFARRDLTEWSGPHVLLVLLARCLKTVGVSIPRLGWARAIGDRELDLDARARLWSFEGYARCVLYTLAPQLFRQSRFFSHFEFRAEKRRLSTS